MQNQSALSPDCIGKSQFKSANYSRMNSNDITRIIFLPNPPRRVHPMDISIELIY